MAYPPTNAEIKAARKRQNDYRKKRGLSPIPLSAFIQHYGWTITKKKNPSRLKGRKVKGGRSVTLKNMASVTIIRRRNGTVGIRGVKK